MKKIFVMIAILFCCQNVFAYQGTPEEQINSFFDDLTKGDINLAVDSLYSSNPAMKQKIQQLTLLKQQIAMLPTLYGRSIGVEKYITEKNGDSIVRFVFIQKHELHPIVWEFFFYKPKDDWLISHGTFNDQFTGLRKQ